MCLSFLYSIRKRKPAQEREIQAMTRVNDVRAAYRKEIETVLRSGFYKNFLVMPVEEGIRSGVSGYLAMFEWYNGYKQTMYMSNQEMKLISEKEKDPAWITDFETMALRTIMREILREFGIMSKEMDAVFC